MLRNFFSQLLYRRLLSASDTHFPDRLKGRILVFSPHFDDETLGCGGTIIKAKEMGASVKIAFMTDGSTSHNHLMGPDELRSLRAQEGIDAAVRLGLVEIDIFRLNFQEGQLHAFAEEAEHRTIDIIAQTNADVIFIPHRNEPDLWSHDHLATNFIVRKAVYRLNKRITICEYPIWYWFHWPWVSVPLSDVVFRKVVIKNTFRFFFGFSILSNFNSVSAINNFLAQKRTALDQHRTQMTRIIPSKTWMTLPDICSGSFLNCFFRNYEIFQRYEFFSV